MCSRRLSLFTLDWGDLEGGGGDEAEHHREGTRQVDSFYEMNRYRGDPNTGVIRYSNGE